MSTILAEPFEASRPLEASDEGMTFGGTASTAATA
jgi:hypothetical protein